DQTRGSAPYAQFTVQGTDLIRGEVTSNAYLAPAYVLDERGEGLLAELGWGAPTYRRGDEPDRGSANFHVDLPRSYADRLAAMAIRALRDVWSVPHPAFLTAETADEELPDLGLPAPAEPEPANALEVGYPVDADDLQRLVDASLTPVFGHPPEKDADGDIPVRSGNTLLFVRVRRDSPVVEVLAPLVRDITGRTRAAEVVADLNRGSSLTKFVLMDDTVFAVVALPARPFVPAHLRDMLALMFQTAHDHDDDLAKRLQGRRIVADAEPTIETSESLDEDVRDDADADDDDESNELAPELLTLLQLDPDGEGSVDAATAASVCGHDRDLILRLLRESEEQQIAWRTSADTDAADRDRDEAEACRHEASGWGRTIETLRGALRLVFSESVPPRASD
ncbi:MAG: hypothetical protein H0V23_10000, partial [Nocardioidaceae bacterium]|nr:hypothetical protein [Nocardioidaceae bacterium]